MKKIIILLIVLGCFVFNACETKKSALSINRMYFNNSTNYVIRFLPYINGSLLSDSIKVFPPNTKTLFESFKYNTSPPGDPQPTFNYQHNADSILVTFDGIKKEMHQYLRITTPTVSFTYWPNKDRSLYSNEGNTYMQNIIEQRKGYIETEFTYTFTEQDYLDAEVIK